MENEKKNIVTVRWHDGYMEEFQANEVRFGSDLLWMRLADGKNRHIPLRSVRWFGMSVESHQTCGPYFDKISAEDNLEASKHTHITT